jgi:predicted RecB family nuclease
LRDAGITDRAGVAALHHPTAVLATDVDLPRALAAATGVPGATPITEVIPRARKQQRVFADAGIDTAADLIAATDPATAELAGPNWLPEAILQARAALGDASVYRRPDAPDGPIERFDVEIDIDMENTPDGVYLWGVLVTDRTGTGLLDGGYRPFVTWEPLTPEAEAMVFSEFWTWLTGLIDRVQAAGHTVAAYCWYDRAETPELQRLAAPDPATADAVEKFITSGMWIDLRRVFMDRWITGGPAGLKPIATLAGYEWPVDDPGGGISIVRHAEATGAGPDAEAARAWLLDYNRGDVEATLAVRDWLTTEGDLWPVVPVGGWPPDR